jgi:hypothetical protein
MNTDKTKYEQKLLRDQVMSSFEESWQGGQRRQLLLRVSSATRSVPRAATTGLLRLLAMMAAVRAGAPAAATAAAAAAAAAVAAAAAAAVRSRSGQRGLCRCRKVGEQACLTLLRWLHANREARSASVCSACMLHLQ